jgi:hypothetical protein
VPDRLAPVAAILIATITAANAIRLTARDSFFEDPAFAHVPAMARSSRARTNLSSSSARSTRRSRTS